MKIANITLAVAGLVIILFAIFVFMKQDSSEKTSTSTPAPSLSALQSPSTSSKKYDSAAQTLKKEEIEGKKVRVRTEKGDIVIELFADAPKAASNFIFLASNGFYDSLTFHRREEGFVIQGGDPKGDGTGGPGYKFEDETVNRDYLRGIVAMANAGPNTNGSQFFIMLKDNFTLPKNYTIFGKVLEGMEVVDLIVVGDTMENVTVE